jgi:hypothetical protein
LRIFAQRIFIRIGIRVILLFGEPGGHQRGGPNQKKGFKHDIYGDRSYWCVKVPEYNKTRGEPVTTVAGLGT